MDSSQRTIQLWMYGALIVVGVAGLAVGYWLERRAKRRSYLTVALTADTSAFAEAMRKLRADFEAAAAAIGERLLPAMREFWRNVTRAFEQPEMALLLAKARHGLGNRTGEGLWQSDLCAGWLHDACPLPGACDCTCHGGALR